MQSHEMAIQPIDHLVRMGDRLGVDRVREQCMLHGLEKVACWTWCQDVPSHKRERVQAHWVGGGGFAPP